MKLRAYDDITLVYLLNNGNKNAFEVIYDRYADGLYRYIFSRIHVKETSEEIIQELFVSLWARRNALVITDDLKAYLYSAAKYKILSYMRTDQVRKKYAMDFIMFAENRLNNSTEEYVELRELQILIESIISELPKQCQAAYRMSRNEHESIQDIAIRMNISTRTVENYITQALKHLRTRLDEELMLIAVLYMNCGWMIE